MNALEFHKLIHQQIKTVQPVKAPEILKINSIPASTDLNPDPLTLNVNQSQSSFPWINWLLIGCVIILGVFLISKIPKVEHYESYFERVRKKSRGR